MDWRNVKKVRETRYDENAVWNRVRPILFRPLMLVQCPCLVGANYNNSLKLVLSCALACAIEKTVEVKDKKPGSKVSLYKPKRYCCRKISDVHSFFSFGSCSNVQSIQVEKLEFTCNY